MSYSKPLDYYSDYIRVYCNVLYMWHVIICNLSIDGNRWE